MNDRKCAGCGSSARPGMRFCGNCGRPIEDYATRYLSAAVHQDPVYCDLAIAEFLVEPVRALSPSPGADPVAVLRDAVAARTRRRIRDAVLLGLLLIIAVVAPVLFVVWLVLAVVVAAIAAAVSGADRPVRPAAVRGLLVAVAGVVGGYVLLELIGLPLPYLLRQLGALAVTDLGVGSGSPDTVALCLALLSFLVLLADAAVVHWLVYACFQRGQFVAHPDSSAGVQGSLRRLGTAPYKKALDRVARAELEARRVGRADVVVHRGFSPFVGAGEIVRQEAIAVPLLPNDGDGSGGRPSPEGDDGSAERSPAIDVLCMHERISEALRGIRASSSLGPGDRFADLKMREQVLVPVEQLVTHLGDQPPESILEPLDRAPKPTMDLQPARGLAADPKEWARYYRCYRAETWGRELVVSCFVTIGADESMLYFERVHCVLMPPRGVARRIDQLHDPLRPLGTALVELLLLPASVPRRFASLSRRFRPLTQMPGEVVPERYGAAKSLREMSGSPAFHTYFQAADAVRYQRIIDSAVVRAVGAYLEEQGYSAVEFQRALRPMINDFRGSQISNSAIGAGARTTNSGGGRRVEEP